ncbi:MAG: putative glutamine/gamma-aminobutyrate antiporter GadC, partial [Plesiomonas sp.]
TVRPYKIPGGKAGIWLIGGVGLFSSALAFVVSFIPPEQISVGNPLTYSLILVLGTAAFVAIPVVLYACRKDSWVSET